MPVRVSSLRGRGGRMAFVRMIACCVGMWLAQPTSVLAENANATIPTLITQTPTPTTLGQGLMTPNAASSTTTTTNASGSATTTSSANNGEVAKTGITLITGCNDLIFSQNAVDSCLGHDNVLSDEFVVTLGATTHVKVQVNGTVTGLQSLKFTTGVDGHLDISDIHNLVDLKSLEFTNVKFDQPKVSLSVSQNLTSVSLSKTNAVSLTLSDTPNLKNVILFDNEEMQEIPSFMYQTQHRGWKLTIVGNFGWKNSTTQLSTTEYAICKSNLAQTVGFVAFVGNCSNPVVPTGSSAALHRVCYIERDETDSTMGSAAADGNINPTAAQSKRGSSDKLFLYIIVAIAVVAIVIVGVFSRKYLSRRTITTSPTNDPSVGLISKDATPMEPMAALANDDVLQPLHLPPHSVTLTKSVGTGRLWLGEYENHKVIIRRVENEAHEKQVIRDLVAQARFLAPVSHTNISSLLGVTWFQGWDFGIVSEFVNRGTLKTVLMDADCELDLLTKLRMCLDVAQGLAYLHASAQRMYLQRLSSHRVLVTRELVCKLNLFDCISLDVPLSVPDQFGGGEMAWWAPELIVKRHTSNPRAANIYSLGVVMGEILTRSPPYAELTDEVGHTLADVELRARARRQESSAPHGRHIEFEHAPVEIRELIYQCLSVNPKGRPTAADVVAVLQTVVRCSEREQQEPTLE